MITSVGITFQDFLMTSVTALSGFSVWMVKKNLKVITEFNKTLIDLVRVIERIKK